MTPPVAPPVPLIGRLILAHGFTQTARSWDRFVELLVERGFAPGSLQAVDLAGHGAASDVTATLWQSADQLVDAGGNGTYVGYSMGGRVALHAALAHPDRVERLVLIGATPGIVDDGERGERRAADDRLADHIEAVGVDQFVDEWLANPLFAGLDAETAMRSDRLRNTTAGLASSLRNAGTGTQQPLWDRLGEIRCPVLLLVGSDDVKFASIAEHMAEHLPDATVDVVDRSGHSAHLEQPQATVDALLGWLGQAPV